MSATQADITVQNEGGIFLLFPDSPAGTEWLNEHVDPEAMHFGRAVVVEHRYINDIVEGAIADGLEVQ